ncbi:MAG TPA: IS21 family transposase [Polyangiaceae bacterium]|nr:IS21 family transposase [Polyangiaceae bacterium]
MRRWQTREELIHQTVTLHREGLSRRAVARALGVSRNTVKKILVAHARARQQPHTALPAPPERAPRDKKTDPFRERVEQLLDKHADITAQRVFEILKGAGYDGGYTAVKDLVRALRPKPKPKPSYKPPEWGPGKMAESDWSPYELTLVDGRKLKVQLFSYVLAHSKRTFYEAFESYDVHALMEGHVGAFERFGGVAARCKYDGQAAVARWEGNQPIYNPRFLAFCAYYEMRPWALRGNPNLRPNVERSFWTHERSFLVAREFADLDDFRRQLRAWLDDTVDRRKRHGSTALERFAEEAPHLLPLPRHPYDTARVLYRLCSIDGFVDYGGNRYAVPYDHVTDFLALRVTERELYVYAADFECVARHELAEHGGHHEIDPEGLHDHRRRRPAIDLDQLRSTYEGMGDGAARFFRLLGTGPARTWSIPARRILTLRERYATADVDAALDHAARYSALSYDAVERILEARHPPRRLDEWVAAETAERLAKALGERCTERSDLSEYDRIAETNDDDHQDDGE